LPTLEKQSTINEIIDKLNSTKIVILTEFQGMSVAEDTELRKMLRKSGIDYKVYKNTLVKQAADHLGVVGIEKHLIGSTALAIGKSDDLITPAKIIKEFSSKHQKLKLKGGILGNKVITSDDVNTLINLPPREVIISMLLGGMQSPLSKLLSVLQAPMRDFVTVLKAIAEKNGTGETTSAPEEAQSPEDDQKSMAESNSDQQTTES